MSSFGDSPIPLTCPNPKCNKKDLSTRLSSILSSGKVRCSRCGSEIIFSSSGVSSLRSAISELDRSSSDIDRAKQDFERAKSQLDGKLKQFEATKAKLSRSMSQIKDGVQFNIKAQV